MSLPQALLHLLSDGDFHSGTELGSYAGASRSAVWKGIEVLRGLGLDIYSVKGKGYKLSGPIQLLNHEKISKSIDEPSRTYLSRLDIYFETDSTNARLLELAHSASASGVACFAERQSEGRGRRGRQWISPIGANIYSSLLWRFQGGASQLGGLSLALAVAVIRCLEESGVQDLQLKWPNDVLWQGRKLAGLLLEMVGEASGPCHVVVGVGINVNMPRDQGDIIEQPWCDLQTCVGGAVDRNHLGGRLISHLIHVLREFESNGLGTLLDEWRMYDAFYGREVSIHQPSGVVSGIARGVDETGALLLELGGGFRRFHSGEVSLRLRA